jgi:hypothetical protein
MISKIPQKQASFLSFTHQYSWCARDESRQHKMNNAVVVVVLVDVSAAIF